MGRHLPFSLPAPVRPSSAPWGAESASMTVRIETRRLRLRPFEAADAAAVEDCVGRWEIARMTTRIAHPYPKGAAATWIAGHAAARAPGSALGRAAGRDRGSQQVYVTLVADSLTKNKDTSEY